MTKPKGKWCEWRKLTKKDIARIIKCFREGRFGYYYSVRFIGAGAKKEGK